MSLVQYDDSAQYLVYTEADPVILKVIGKANYLNCSPVADFFKQMTAKGHLHFAINLEECVSMDSTFLGLITGAATRLMNKYKDGCIILYKMSPRNLELINNMGLHHVFKLESGDIPVRYFLPKSSSPSSLTKGSLITPDLILDAHKELMHLNPDNENQFKDVVAFLQEDIAKGS